MPRSHALNQTTGKLSGLAVIQRGPFLEKPIEACDPARVRLRGHEAARRCTRNYGLLSDNGRWDIRRYHQAFAPLAARELDTIAEYRGLLFIAGGLYRMQGWSRWASIAIFAIALVRIPLRLARVHDVAFVMVQGLFALFLFWAIRYLTRPYAISAFRLASLRRSRQNLHPPQPLPHP